jgi:hypothetical protein
METYLDVIIVLMVRFARKHVVSLLNTSLQGSLAINNRLRLGVTVQLLLDSTLINDGRLLTTNATGSVFIDPQQGLHA